jgi:hypothetical protein
MFTRLMTVLLSLCLCFTQITWAAAATATEKPATTKPATKAAAPAKPANNQAKPQVEEKIAIWGILLNIVVQSAMSAFKTWLFNRLTGGTGQPANTGNTPSFSAPNAVASTASGPQTIGDYKKEIRRAAISTIDDFVATHMTRLLDSMFSAKSAEPVVAQPTTPLKVQDGTPNYQGVHIAIVGADRGGKLTGFRAVNEGFRTGERFKLRVVATFDGMLTIVNINPNDERKQIYPPASRSVVSLKAGEETFIPLGADEFFEFAGAKGTEQLVVTMVDPRALDGKASRQKVFREDESYGSNFVQEVSPDTYPVISQAISLIHQ